MGTDAFAKKTKLSGAGKNHTQFLGRNLGQHLCNSFIQDDKIKRLFHKNIDCFTNTIGNGVKVHPFIT